MLTFYQTTLKTVYNKMNNIRQHNSYLLLILLYTLSEHFTMPSLKLTAIQAKSIYLYKNLSLYTPINNCCADVYY